VNSLLWNYNQKKAYDIFYPKSFNTSSSTIETFINENHLLRLDFAKFSKKRGIDGEKYTVF
jgi:hypothetical protein